MSSSSKAAFQLTLALLKPDVTPMRYHVGAIRDMMLARGFLVVGSKEFSMTKKRAAGFYQEHEGKFFYNRLVTYMSSGPTQAYILYKPDAIADWRALMGPTKVFRSRFEAPDSIRGTFGLTDTRNSSHGSDSEDNARNEIKFFFPEFDPAAFVNSGDGSAFREGRVRLDRSRFVHEVE